MEKQASRQEFAKVMRWLAGHPTERYFLMDSLGPYEPEEYIEVIEKLEADSLEYLIPLVLQCNPQCWEFAYALDCVTADALVQQWEEMGADSFLQKIKRLTWEAGVTRRHLAEEIKKAQKGEKPT